MSFIQLNGMNDTKELTLAPDGEYSLVISRAEIKDSKNSPGRDVLHVRIEFEDHDEYAGFMNYVAFPSRKIDIEQNPNGEKAGQEKYDNMMRGLKRFLHLFSISVDEGFDTEDLQGATCIAAVTQEAQEDDETRINQRLIVPKMPVEE